tara:strand:- start:3057 stop:4037 length:981 start_codon:yes stop_codon:yes gene_type:complete
MSMALRYVILGAIIILFILAGLFLGPANYSFIDGLYGIFSSSDGNDGIVNTIMWSIRIPRVAVSIVVGACLGLAGALIQISTRSPLGDPNLFGIGGASAIFLACSAAGLFVSSGPLVFIGAAGFSVIISLILIRLINTQDLTPIRLVLMGIALGSLTIAISTAVISHGSIFSTQVLGLVAGSFAYSSWNVFYYVSLTLLICGAVTIILAKRFQPIVLGDTLSKSLGVDPFKMRFISMLMVGILTAASVYGGGMIGFVGLISPHISRRLFGNSTMHLFIGSMISGILITMLSDQFARLLFAPTELPVGLATTIIGAPLMMYLALRLK